MKWTREELEVAVKAYIKMRELERRGKKFVKQRFYNDLGTKSDRAPGTFFRRMQNISHVFELLGMKRVKGLKPENNIGSHLPIIAELILEHNPSVNPKLEFEVQVLKLRHKKIVTQPSGKRSPKKKKTEPTTYHIRDPEVAVWLFENSKGVCENCGKPAPFSRVDGSPFLEVHHVKRLEDGGSDRINNAIVVCPNCHRELHYGAEKETLLEALYNKIERLERK